MRVYNSQVVRKRKDVRNGIFAVVLSVVIVGLSIFFAVKGTDAKTNGNVIEIEKPIVSVTESYSLPVDGCTLLREASIDKLVYNESTNMWKTHNGIDLTAKDGAEVKAVFSGKVTSVKQSTLDGIVVTIQQNDGIYTTYKSLAQSVVKEGDTVKNGAVIGSVGSMLSENGQGAHLHLEMKKDGKYIDPLALISVPGQNK